MKISVEHSTVYRYDDAVYLEPHTFRLQPRMTGAQRLLAFDLLIEPAPVGTVECLDQDGNLALHAWFDSPTREMTVRTRFAVELLADNPFAFVLDSESLHLPLRYREPLASALAPYRRDTHIAEPVKKYAQSAAAEAQWNTLPFLSAVNQELFRNCNHVIRPDGAPWLPEQTLREREGSCRDLAVLFCDVCRVMGFAARFVSGYECASAGPQHDAYMHAWAEVYLPGVGWRGYDPSRGLAVANAHVAVAAGFDHDLASPVAGSYRGASGSRMEASLRMDIVAA